MTIDTATEADTFDALLELESSLKIARALATMGADAATRERNAKTAATVDRAFDAAWMNLTNGQIERFFIHRATKHLS